MHLPANELEQFLRVQSALNNFIYAQLQRAAGREAKLPFRELPFDKQMEVREAFATNPEYVERFVAENPSNLSSDDLRVALSWRIPLAGEFYLIKHLKKHSIFISNAESPQVYGVVGLTKTLAEIIPADQLPLRINALLLPIGGKIVYDGLLPVLETDISRDDCQQLTAVYQSAKEGPGVLTALPEAETGDHILQSSPRPSRKRTASATTATKTKTPRKRKSAEEPV